MQSLNNLWFDLRVIGYWLLPYLVTFPTVYLVGAFVEFSLNPQNWTWNARLVTALFGVCYGYALHMRMDVVACIVTGKQIGRAHV